MNNIVLKINGKKYDGWESVQVEKSLFNITGSFGLLGTDIFPNEFQKWEFSLGDACKVEIDEQTIINGYVEDIPISYDHESHEIQIGGRDKTGDLVDCSFVETDQEWKGRSIAEIITALCLPFDIDVVVDDSVSTEANQEPKDTFKSQMGDSIFDIIHPMLQNAGILPVSYADGKLTLTRAGTDKTSDSLEFGKNIKSGNISQSMMDQFNSYVVKGQDIGNDNKTDTKIFVSPEGIFTDQVITRYRPKIVLSESKLTSADCKKRAQWEADNRAGQSISIEYEVQGWTQTNGNVWPLNALVQVKDSFLGIDGTLLIAAVTFEVANDSGKITKLMLVDPKTFDLDPTRNAVNNTRTKASWRNKLLVTKSEEGPTLITQNGDFEEI